MSVKVHICACAIEYMYELVCVCVWFLFSIMISTGKNSKLVRNSTLILVSRTFIYRDAQGTGTFWKLI